jgi:hypothetical protein
MAILRNDTAGLKDGVTKELLAMFPDSNLAYCNVGIDPTDRKVSCAFGFHLVQDEEIIVFRVHTEVNTDAKGQSFSLVEFFNQKVGWCEGARITGDFLDFQAMPRNDDVESAAYLLELSTLALTQAATLLIPGWSKR